MAKEKTKPRPKRINLYMRANDVANLHQLQDMLGETAMSRVLVRSVELMLKLQQLQADGYKLHAVKKGVTNAVGQEIVFI